MQVKEVKDHEKYDSISSIVCIAHVGLGRYGDKIDPNGYKKAIKTINILSKDNSTIYILAPVGIWILLFPLVTASEKYIYSSFFCFVFSKIYI